MMKTVNSNSRDVSHERGPGLGAGHLAEDMTSELRCLPGDERPEVLRGPS